MANSCPHCGVSVTSDMCFCSQCGYDLTVEHEHTGEERRGYQARGSYQQKIWRADMLQEETGEFIKRRLLGLSVNFGLVLSVLVGLVVLLFIIPGLRLALGIAIVLTALIASMTYKKLRSSLRQYTRGFWRRLLV